jgi:hypothetical protein
MRIVRSMVPRIGSSRARTAISTPAIVRRATRTDNRIQTETLPDLSSIVARLEQQIGLTSGVTAGADVSRERQRVAQLDNLRHAVPIDDLQAVQQKAGFVT